MYLCGKLWIEKMASKRYGSGVFVRLTGEQEMFVRELAVGGVSRQTVIRAALLFMMRAKYGEKPDEEEL